MRRPLFASLSAMTMCRLMDVIIIIIRSSSRHSSSCNRINSSRSSSSVRNVVQLKSARKLKLVSQSISNSGRFSCIHFRIKGIHHLSVQHARLGFLTLEVNLSTRKKTLNLEPWRRQLISFTRTHDNSHVINKRNQWRAMIVYVRKWCGILEII